jgi:hypothetical protein
MPQRIQRKRTASPGPQRFMQRINKDGPVPTHVPHLGPCWVWQGAPNNSKGYGRVTVARKRYLAHRYAYQLWVGGLVAGMEIDHLCRNTGCVNPRHLEQVTPEEHKRRTDQGAYQRAKTHCPVGHQYTADNIRWSRQRRHCKACGSNGKGLKGSNNGQSKLTEPIVREARARREAGEEVGALAMHYGVAQSVMSRALTGVTWSHVA